MGPSARLLILLAATPLGCKPELPPLDYKGERVLVGSDVVEQVCEGTLVRLDREVELIEDRLDLPINDSRLAVYVVEGSIVDAYCGSPNCVIIRRHRDPFAMIRPGSFERSVAHELVHARLSKNVSVPLFQEGIAEAASPPSCPRMAGVNLDEAEVLAASTGHELLGIAHGYYAAGEFVSWLIESEGAEAVARLLGDIDSGSSPGKIEAEYHEHFDREIEDDLFAHFRTHDDLEAMPAEHFGCLAPQPPVDSQTGDIQLVADLDCDSDRVHNHFDVDDGGYVEWTLVLEHDQTLELVGHVPEGTSLAIQECACVRPKGQDEYLLPRPLEAVETLQTGTYRLQWSGSLGDAQSLDVEMHSID